MLAAALGKKTQRRRIKKGELWGSPNPLMPRDV